MGFIFFVRFGYRQNMHDKDGVVLRDYKAGVAVLVSKNYFSIKKF